MVKYNPAPTDVRNVEGKTPLQRSLILANFFNSLVIDVFKPVLVRRCCCNLVFNKSNGWSVKADTKPALPPEIRWILVLGTFTSGGAAGAGGICSWSMNTKRVYVEIREGEQKRFVGICEKEPSFIVAFNQKGTSSNLIICKSQSGGQSLLDRDHCNSHNTKGDKK